MLLRTVISLICLMASHFLFATCPKTIPNGALLSKLATDSGTFKLLGKTGGTYILGYQDRYISVVDNDNSLSALNLSNLTTLKAIRILGKINASILLLYYYYTITILLLYYHYTIIITILLLYVLLLYYYYTITIVLHYPLSMWKHWRRKDHLSGIRQ